MPPRREVIGFSNHGGPPARFGGFEGATPGGRNGRQAYASYEYVQARWWSAGIYNCCPDARRERLRFGKPCRTLTSSFISQPTTYCWSLCLDTALASCGPALSHPPPCSPATAHTYEVCAQRHTYLHTSYHDVGQEASTVHSRDWRLGSGRATDVPTSNGCSFAPYPMHIPSPHELGPPSG